jgi:hypothetical protein
MKEFVKCIALNVDWIVKKTDGLQSLNKLSLLYWDHIQHLPSNPKKYPSSPHSPKRFRECDFESLSLSPEKIQRFEGQLNVTGFNEGELLS